MKSFLKSTIGYITSMLICIITFGVIVYFNVMAAIMVTMLLLLIITIIYIALKLYIKGAGALLIGLVLLITCALIYNVNDYNKPTGNETSGKVENKFCQICGKLLPGQGNVSVDFEGYEDVFCKCNDDINNSKESSKPEVLNPSKPQISEVPKPEVPKPEVPKPEVPKPEVPKPEVPKPEVPKPEVPKPEVPKPEVPKPEVPKPEVPKPEVPKPEVPKPEVPKPEVPKPEVPKPEVPKPEVPKPEVPKPEVPKPEEKITSEINFDQHTQDSTEVFASIEMSKECDPKIESNLPYSLEWISDTVFYLRITVSGSGELRVTVSGDNIKTNEVTFKY